MLAPRCIITPSAAGAGALASEMDELRAEMRRDRMAADARISVLEDDMRTLRAKVHILQSAAAAPGGAPIESAPPPAAWSVVARAGSAPPPANTSNTEIRTPARGFAAMMAAHAVGADAHFFRTVQSRARVNEDAVADGLAGTIACAFAREAAAPGGAPLSIDSRREQRHAFLMFDGSVWQPMTHDDFAGAFKALMKRLSRAYRERRAEGVAGAADFLKVTEATAHDVSTPRFVQLARRKLYEALPNARAA